MNAAVFCDFDGTIFQSDVGYQFFHHFSNGHIQKLEDAWQAGQLSSRQALLEQAAMVRISRETVFEFLDQFEIDESFVEFYRVCESHSVPVFVVSEGLDLYIHYLLGKSGLAGLQILCNRGVVTADRLQVEFPYSNRVCPRCGSCKGERIVEYRQKLGSPCTVIFAGDGLSDICAVHEADVVFAKKDLLQYCQSENIEYNVLNDFSDITRFLEQLRC